MIIEKMMNYKTKGVEMKIDVAVNEFGMDFLIHAKGIYKHELEISKGDYYNICWTCSKDGESLIDITTGIEIKDLEEFNSKVISEEYISDELFEQHIDIFKEIIVIMREVMNIKAYRIVDNSNNNGIALRNDDKNNYEISIGEDNQKNEIISEEIFKTNYIVIEMV